MRSKYGRLHGQITIDGITAEFDLSVDASAAGMVEQILRHLQQRGNIPAADESPRPRKEQDTWRDDERASECSARTVTEEDGESYSLRHQIKNAVSTLRRNAKQSKLSGSLSRSSRKPQA
jgi:hypothetical protein